MILIWHHYSKICRLYNLLHVYTVCNDHWVLKVHIVGIIYAAELRPFLRIRLAV